MSSEKKTRGRQKIEMKKISNENICTLCGAYVALIIFSPSEKVFSFGHPNVEMVINCYLSQVAPQNDDIMKFIGDDRCNTPLLKQHNYNYNYNNQS